MEKSWRRPVTPERAAIAIEAPQSRALTRHTGKGYGEGTHHRQPGLQGDLPQTHASETIWITATHQKHSVNHISNCKFSSSHIKKERKERGEIKFNDIFYLTQDIQSIIISTCNQYKKLFTLFSYFVFEICYVFSTHLTSQFGYLICIRNTWSL